MRKFNRYKENLRRVGNDIWSYSTHVATIEYPGKLIQHGWWSVTTQKHINYVARELGQHALSRRTKCVMPCSYMEYKVSYSCYDC